jgi:membrane protein DedA with SNARE-associated domain
MLSEVITAVTQWILHVISTLGYSGIALLMAIESAAIPLPSEIIMPFAGFLVAQGRFGLHEVALAGAFGSAVGSAVTYALGYYGGRPLIERYGRYVFIPHSDLERADRFFARFGNLAGFIGRMLPVIRTFISIPAGIGKVRFIPFLIYSFIGSYIWSLFLAYLGFKLGERWTFIRVYLEKLDFLIVTLGIAVIVWWIRRHLRNRHVTSEPT